MKRLICVSDGTWNTPEQSDRGKRCPSNVAKMARWIAPEDGSGNPQLVFYDAGVGTNWYDRLLGGGFGVGLSQNVQDAYMFLVKNYAPGDEIYLFGFSRGAYTARSIAGLIRNAGLLRREHAGKLAEAYALYRRRDDKSHPATPESQQFRERFSLEITIRCVGVWDTVGALGIPMDGFRRFNARWAFHDVRLSKIVENAFQALAIDERRKAFAPTLWQGTPDRPSQRLEQVWFPGVHTNVGGGYCDSGLSDIALRWMGERAASCGLALNPGRLDERITPNPLGEIRDSKIGLFRFESDFVRKMGEAPHAFESVIAAARTRLTHGVYPAPNLRAFLDNGGQEYRTDDDAVQSGAA